MSAPAAAVTGSASTLLSTHAAASATLPLTPALQPTYHHQIKPKIIHFQTRTCWVCDETQYKNWYRQFSYHFQKDNVHCSNCYLSTDIPKETKLHAPIHSLMSIIIHYNDPILQPRGNHKSLAAILTFVISCMSNLILLLWISFKTKTLGSHFVCNVYLLEVCLTSQGFKIHWVSLASPSLIRSGYEYFSEETNNIFAEWRP